MNGLDSKITAFQSLQPSEYSFVEMLMLTYPDDDAARSHRTLSILLSNYPRVPRAYLRLNFSAVSNLRIRPDTFELRYLPQLSITDIRSYQWEQARYEVRELEDSVMSFFCADFTAQIEPSY